jgi:hypothetical protein
MELRYSPYPPSAYSVEYMGVRFGLGVYPPLVDSRGAWNLFWLSYPPLDKLLTWPVERAGEVPCYIELVDLCIATALQSVRGRALGTLATSLRPVAFVQGVATSGKDLQALSLYQALGGKWVTTMADRGQQAEARFASQPEEKLSVSANIIPFRRR